ncbi:MAG: rod shape-determining protein MreC [Deltaproteobacteria bacterium]|nr:rod shape-determining protein MreC [Deltaproteobacteria bacterium]
MLNLKRIRIAWIWIVFIFFTLFLLSSNLGRRRSWNPIEQIIIEVTAPAQKFIKKTISFTENIWLKYFGLINVQVENTRLKREIDALRMESYRYRELLDTNRRLQELLNFKETINYPVLAAQVIGRDPTGWFKSVIIDKGKKSGLKTNMPVVNAIGVVGRLVSVSLNYAKVLLIIDQNSAVDCIVQRSRDKGIVKGISSKICKLDYVLKTGDVVIGDMVITSGLGRVFPKRLPVGEVIEVNSMPGELFKRIEVRPVVDFSKLEELLVILKEDTLLNHQKEEKD